MKYLLFILTCILFVSCGHHRDGTSVWAEGLWLIPVVELVGAGLFFRVAWIKSHSGSHQQQDFKEGANPNNPGGYKDTKGNVSIFKTGQFWFSMACLLALVVTVIVVNGEKG